MVIDRFVRFSFRQSAHSECWAVTSSRLRMQIGIRRIWHIEIQTTDESVLIFFREVVLSWAARSIRNNFGLSKVVLRSSFPPNEIILPIFRHFYTEKKKNCLFQFLVPFFFQSFRSKKITIINKTCSWRQQILRRKNFHYRFKARGFVVLIPLVKRI